MERPLLCAQVMKFVSSALATALCLSAAGCIVEGDEVGSAEPGLDDTESSPAGGGSDQPTGNGDILATKNGNAFLLSGYHTLFDKTTSGSCVEAADEPGVAPYTVGNVSEAFQLSYVTSREQLAEELGIDLGLQVRYGAVNAEGALGFVNRFSQTSRSVSFLLKATQEYTVTNRRAARLTDEAKGRLNTGANSFTRACGTSYINGVRYGAGLMLLITYRAVSAESAMALKASLGVEAAAQASPVSGDLQVRLEKAASIDGVTVNIKALSEGVFLDDGDSGLVDGLVVSSVDSSLFEQVDEIRNTMASSVHLDACRDAGLPDCGGEAGPGYPANTHRNARATGVSLGFYDSLPNATWTGQANPFQQVRDRLSHVDRFVRDYTEIQNRLEEIYYNEIKPFVDASPADKALYNVVPPGRPFRTPAGLMELAMQLDEEIYPLNGSVVGWKMGEVMDRIQDCWDQASIDLFTSCTAGDMPYAANGEPLPEGELSAVQTQRWNELYAIIGDYNRNTRILPLSARAGTAAVTFPEAAEQCANLSSGLDIEYRLATRDEVQLLAPFVGFGNVDWSDAMMPHATWYTPDAANSCPTNTPFPLYANQPQETGEDFQCIQEVDASWWQFWAEDEFHVVPVCVPATGAVPVLPDV